MRKTIYDVAQEAEVSISTVSRALNNSGYVSEKAKAKIKQAADGFFPNAAARTINTKRSYLIGVVSFIPPQRFFRSGTLPDSLAGITDYANVSGYRLLLNIGVESKNCVKLYRQNIIDGIIFISGVEDLSLLRQIGKHNIPAAFLGDTIEEDENIRVCVSNEKSVAEAVNYLVSLGHRSIAMIGGMYENASARHRYEGYKKALLINEFPVDESLVRFCRQPTEEDAYKAAKDLLNHPHRPTAILTYDDDMAMGVFRAAKEVKLSIPGDLSIIGFDDGKIASLTQPALTTIAQPSYYKGRLIAQKLIQYIENLRNGDDAKPHSEILECKLVIRDSCAFSPEINK